VVVAFPGMFEYVQPVRGKSLFWHKLLLKCGRPKNGVVADCLRRKHAAYYCAIRKTKTLLSMNKCGLND